jgi:hypothetical protein
VYESKSGDRDAVCSGGLASLMAMLFAFFGPPLSAMLSELK